jgi:hypothetical protein
MRIRRSAIGLFLFAILLSDLQIQRAAAATPTTSGLYACSFSTQNRNNALTDGPATGGSPCATITSIGSNIDADSAYALSPNITDKNGISYAWTGYFKAPTTGNYIFATRTRWWSYLWIDDLAVSGAKYNHATTFNSSTNNATLRNQAETDGATAASTGLIRTVTISLTANVYYPIKLIYGNSTDPVSGYLVFGYKKPGDANYNYTLNSANGFYNSGTNLANYSITYNGNSSSSGSVPTSATGYNENESLAIPSNTGSLLKSGQSFYGWNTSLLGNETDYIAGSTFTFPSSNTTLFAKWVSTTPVFSSFGLEGSSITAAYRTRSIISATVSVASRVTFFVDGKKIPGCVSKLTTESYPSATVDCSFRPSTRGQKTLTATAKSVTGGISTTSSKVDISIGKRTGPRVR